MSHGSQYLFAIMTLLISYLTETQGDNIIISKLIFNVSKAKQNIQINYIGRKKYFNYSINSIFILFM